MINLVNPYNPCDLFRLEQAQREAKKLEEAVETGMAQRKGMGKKKRAAQGEANMCLLLLNFRGGVSLPSSPCSGRVAVSTCVPKFMPKCVCVCPCFYKGPRARAWAKRRHCLVCGYVTVFHKSQAHTSQANCQANRLHM